VARLRDEDVVRCADLLTRLRSLADLTERSAGVFYRGSTPFLHFHGKGEDLVADLKVDGAWLRYPAARASARRVLATDAGRALRGVTGGLRGELR